ncbi:hypothetical protein [Dolichospermum sp. UHCC 0259]|uniref:hypothetical protein n=1 Tax=Dolichospermum sp. UHCC 0259 TaxID=2590010 RepID=UPI00144695A0|nr:hypothetical protein [Dolichospermum sp. UHCC 0259]MTJ49879.1 hypothetical protein [Dolichospermum sp. UHCC 0259]
MKKNQRKSIFIFFLFALSLASYIFVSLSLTSFTIVKPLITPTVKPTRIFEPKDNYPKLETTEFSEESQENIRSIKELMTNKSCQAPGKTTIAMQFCNNNIIVNTIYWPEPIKIKGEGKTFQPVIQVFGEAYQWKLGSIKEIEDSPKGLNTLTETINKQWLQVFRRSKYVIAVGTASVEGKYSEQKGLAFERAKEISKKIQETYSSTQLPNKIGNYTLNLGQFVEKTCLKNNYFSTKYQRPIMLISIVEGEDDYTPKELKEYLEFYLNSSSERGDATKATCYSDFDLSPN